MSRVSVIIPSRNEQYLAATIDDVFAKARGDIEVVAVLDGPSDYPLARERPNLVYVNHPKPLGFRVTVNHAARVATGKYLMKLDAHSLLSDGFDVLLQARCEDNWLLTARRNELDAEAWRISDETPCDYFYWSSPWTSPNGYMRDYRWVSRTNERMHISLDETMSISGSMWFCAKSHWERIGGMDEQFGHFGEPQEMCGKTWVSGGAVMVNKLITYAHLRGKRKYSISLRTSILGYQRVTNYWATDAWQSPYRVRDFGWIIDHFWPLPTAETRVRGEKYVWEPDWRERYYHA